MRYVGVGNVTTAGLALALPERWELWRAFARARIVSLCRTADRWDVGRRVWRQPSNASKVSSGSRLCENALRVECDEMSSLQIALGAIFSTSPRVKRPPTFLSGGVFTQARSTAGSPALRLTRPKVAVRTGPAASGTVMCARTRPDLGRKRSPRLSFKRSTDSISL